MNMERSTGPRIYVPINMPDHASQPTYAVLEFVGFSCPAGPSTGASHFLHSPSPPTIASPSPPAPSSMLCLPHASSSSLTAPAAAPTTSFYALPAAAPPRHAAIPTPPLLPICHFPADSAAFLIPSPSPLLPPPSHHHQLYHYAPARPHPSGARLQVVNLESPPPSPSCASSASRESSREKHSSSSAKQVLPMDNVSGAKPIVCFAPSIPDSSSAFMSGSSTRPAVNLSSPTEGPHQRALGFPGAKFSQMTEKDLMQTRISVSQTDRETIVHTHSSNFRDVVRQLTGASSDDQDLLPVTLPLRLANRINNAAMVQNHNFASTEMGASGAGAGGTAGSSAVANGNGPPNREQLGLRKAPLKLHERRKSTMKNLEKVTSAYSLYGAAEVSPTIMNPSPVTPLASDFERCCNASTPTSQGSSGLSSPIALLGKGRGAMEASVGRVGDESLQQESGCCFSLQCSPVGVRTPSSPLEKPAAPTLLSLFPESPSCSPHGLQSHI